MLKCRQYEDLRKQLGVREEDSIEKVLFGGGEEYLLRLEENESKDFLDGREIDSKQAGVPYRSLYSYPKVYQSK